MLRADVVVLATGFETDMRADVARILGPDVSGQLEPFWVLDDEGELRGECKPSGREYILSFLFLFLAKFIPFSKLLVGPVRCWHLDARRDPGHFEISFEVYCLADQGSADGNAAGALREEVSGCLQ